MTRLRNISLLILSLTLLTACSANGLYQVTLVTGDQHTFTENSQGDLILLGGSATLAENARLEGNVHILNGSFQVNGEVGGDIAFLNGELALGPSARISGDLNLGSGAYTTDAGAVVSGRINSGTGVQIPDLPERTGPDLVSRAVRGLITGALTGLAAAALSRRFPVAVARVGEAATHHALVSGAVGALVGLVGLSLMVTIAYTILLIPVALIGVMVLGLAVLYGWIGFGTIAGRWVAKSSGKPPAARRTAFFGTLVFVWLLEIVSGIPVIGVWIGLGASMIGLGAVALTRFGIHPFEPAPERDEIF